MRTEDTDQLAPDQNPLNVSPFLNRPLRDREQVMRDAARARFRSAGQLRVYR